MIETLQILAGMVGSAIVGFLLTLPSRYSNKEIEDIFRKIHNAKTEASDEGTEMTDAEALDIIDDIIIAYLE